MGIKHLWHSNFMNLEKDWYILDPPLRNWLHKIWRCKDRSMTVCLLRFQNKNLIMNIPNSSESGLCSKKGAHLAGSDDVACKIVQNHLPGSLKECSNMWSKRSFRTKGTEEHNSAAENVWKEPPSFYTQAAYVSTTNTVIYRLIFSRSVKVGMSFHFYFVVEAHSTRSYPQPIRPYLVHVKCTFHKGFT